MEQKIHSAEEMEQVGFELAEKLTSGEIVLLHGDLGAGKTTLTKGIAKYFGIDEVVSPTFTLMQVYQVNHGAMKQLNNLVHVDTYRLEKEEELLDIGIEDYLGAPDTICLIEWPEKISTLLINKKTISIDIAHTGENQRQITTTFPPD